MWQTAEEKTEKVQICFISFMSRTNTRNWRCSYVLDVNFRIVTWSLPKAAKLICWGYLRTLFTVDLIWNIKETGDIYEWHLLLICMSTRHKIDSRKKHFFVLSKCNSFFDCQIILQISRILSLEIHQLIPVSKDLLDDLDEKLIDICYHHLYLEGFIWVWM